MDNTTWNDVEQERMRREDEGVRRRLQRYARQRQQEYEDWYEEEPE